MTVFCFVLEHHLDGKAATKEVGVRPIHVWWRWRYRSARFRARRHAAPKNSPPDCFLYGCFDYIPQQKYKSTTRVLLIFGGDGGNRNRVQNRLIGGSTSVGCLLSYPLTQRRQSAYALKYSLIPDESRDTLSFMFATKSTLSKGPWHYLKRTKARLGSLKNCTIIVS